MGNIKKQSESKHKFSVQDIIFSLKNFFLSSQSIAGIEIGNKYIKIVQLQKKRTDYLLNNYRIRALPSQAKENPKERQKLISGFVKEFMLETRIRTKLGRIAFWGGGSYLFSLSIPAVSEKDIKGIVNIELKKRLPFQVDLTNILSNFFVTDKISDEKGSIFQVTCIAVDKHILNENINILKDIGMRPTTINVIPDALGNVVAAIDKESDSVGILDMGAKDSTFNFYKKNLLLFSRQIPIGGEQFTLAIMKAMSSLGMSNVTLENAEKVKRQCGIPLEDEVFLEYFTDFGVIKGNQIAMGLRPSLERFNTEITRTINYYYRTFRINAIDALYITGGSSRLKNIEKLLKSNLQNLSIAKIERLDPLKAIKGWVDSSVLKHELVMEEAAPHLSAAFGLCIDKGGKINLLPAKEIIEQKISYLSALVRVLFFVILIIILSFSWAYYGKCFSIEKNIIARTAELKEFEPHVKEVKKYMSIKAHLTGQRNLLESVVGRQPLWIGVLKELSKSIPDGVMLQSLEVKTKGKKLEMYLMGEVFADYTTIEVAFVQFHGMLDESPYFTNIRPTLGNRDIYSPIPKATFEITCDLVY